MRMENETLHLIALNFIPGVGPRTAKKLISLAGSAKEFFLLADNLKIAGVKAKDLTGKSLKSYLQKAEDELNNGAKNGIRAINYLESDYPFRLSACEDAPLVLHCRGKMDLNASRTIAIVGSRSATSYGNRVCDEFITEMARLNCTLVSGLAYGIDSFAHKAADKIGIQNVGVVAHGLDIIYPGSNLKLSKSMENFGGVVSDFPTGTKPDRENFPKRNRIIAGLADAVIVVEAGKKGGALITADIASAYNRDVFAVPGRIDDSMSEGCNRLIKNNRAAILSSVKDLSWYMGWDGQKESQQTSLFSSATDEEKKILSFIRNGNNHPDLLSVNAEMPVSKVNALLLGLEFKGLIQALPGKKYQLIG